MASVVWTRPLDTEFGPLDDVPEREREQLWPAARRQRLLERLPERRAMERTRFGTCAVVGSSPELLLYSDGAAIDAHDAVFRANMAVTAGYEEHAGRRTSVRIVNPVEDVFKARKRSEDGTEIIIKNQDPPVIRSPAEQHGRFLGQVSTSSKSSRRTLSSHIYNHPLTAPQYHHAGPPNPTQRRGVRR